MVRWLLPWKYTTTWWHTKVEFITTPNYQSDSILSTWSTTESWLLVMASAMKPERNTGSWKTAGASHGVKKDTLESEEEQMNATSKAWQFQPNQFLKCCAWYFIDCMNTICIFHIYIYTYLDIPLNYYNYNQLLTFSFFLNNILLLILHKFHFLKKCVF